jgi:hypothetical protein
LFDPPVDDELGELISESFGEFTANAFVSKQGLKVLTE